jgi:hypothetical protein
MYALFQFNDNFIQSLETLNQEDLVFEFSILKAAGRLNVPNRPLHSPQFLPPLTLYYNLLFEVKEIPHLFMHCRVQILELKRYFLESAPI